MTVFVKADNSDDFKEKEIEIYRLIKSIPENSDFPVMIVAQSPVNNKNIEIEITVLMISSTNYSYTYNRIDEGEFCQTQIGDDISIYGAVKGDVTISEKDDTSAYNNAIVCFDKMNAILKNQILNFGNIVRQWGYIGKITNYELRICDEGKIETENYQMFNVARSEFYNIVNWKHGYPSATGIGMSVVGCSMEFIATNDSPDKIIIPLQNPKQSNAHEYTGKQFINNSINNIQPNTPKFERGKIVISGNSLDLFVSGTAAIIGEDSIPGNIDKQTQTTIENIIELCTKENIDKQGIFIENDLPPFSGVRAYIKEQKDAEIVEKICRKAFGNIPILCVIADVCREELLVEIEAYLNCSIKVLN
ncbi:MAG: hypothetical protein EPN82_08840 [Bacteroidetes bacterium]|nr:MAG: hypothetical protein EPN82_08840 [Bacteroidota bacterium]